VLLFYFHVFPITTNRTPLHQFSKKSGIQYVAKRFYRLGDQEDENINSRKAQTISINDQKLYMQSELSRLIIGQWFLSAFYRLALGDSASIT